MKKTIIIILCLSSILTTFSQNRSEYFRLTEDEDEYQLRRELSEINNSGSLVIYLREHAADYSDLDSLYVLLENKPCPKDFSYNLIHGKSSNNIEVSHPFFYILGRNIHPSFKLNSENYKSIEDVDWTKFQLIKENFNYYNEIENENRNEYQFQLNPINIARAEFSCDIDNKIQVPNEISKWYELMDRNFALGKIYKNPEICESNDPLPYKIVFYSINCEKPDREKLIYDLGSSQIAKNIVSYWGSQCFSDVLFIKINDRFVWFDIDK